LFFPPIPATGRSSVCFRLHRPVLPVQALSRDVDQTTGIDRCLDGRLSVLSHVHIAFFIFDRSGPLFIMEQIGTSRFSRARCNHVQEK
jgi:hypothetical protein